MAVCLQIPPDPTLFIYELLDNIDKHTHDFPQPHQTQTFYEGAPPPQHTRTTSRGRPQDQMPRQTSKLTVGRGRGRFCAVQRSGTWCLPSRIKRSGRA
jgi:hypothetical protein